MIVDAHVHLVALGKNSGGFLSSKMSTGVIFRVLKRVLGIEGKSREELDINFQNKLVEWVDESSVDALGLLAFDGVYDENGELDRARTHVYIPNDYAFEVAARSSALMAIASINPKRKDAIDELHRVAEKGAIAIKTLPNSQDFDPQDPAFTTFWRTMADLKIPLLTHTSFEHTIPSYNQTFGKPERLKLALEQGTTVIAAHCSSAGTIHIKEDIQTWFQMLLEYPNLYGDISAMASLSRYQYIHKILDHELALTRVILGSDFPVPVSPTLFSKKLGIKKARELKKIKNPIEKNYQTFLALGIPSHVMERGAKILRIERELL